MALVGTAIRHGAWFSVTARMNTQVVDTIAAIGEDAWTPIKYPHAIWEEAEQRWVSDAQVAGPVRRVHLPPQSPARDLP